MLKKLMSKNKFSLMFLFILLSMALTSIGFCSWSIYKEFGVYSKNVVDPVCYIKRSDGNVEYYRIEDALDNAKSGEEIYCYVGKNPTITRDCEIKSSVSLIIPFSDTAAYGQRSYDGPGSFGDDASRKENLKNTVTIAKNVTMKVNGGKIKVGGQLGTKGAGLSGQTSGAFSQILMDQNSKILFNSSSSNLLDLYGYIKESTKDNGSYIEMTAGEVKMPFVVYDFRGGTNTVGVYRYGASPFNIFDMPNITPTIKFNSKSKIIGYADLYAGDKHNTTDINILGKSNSLLNFSSENSYLIAKRQQKDALYNSSSSFTDGTYTRLDFYNGLNSGNLELKVSNQTVSTKNVFFPYSFKFQTYLHNGNYNLSTKMKIMTGSTFAVDDNSTLTINNELVVYSKFEDKSKVPPNYPKEKEEGKFIINGDSVINSAFAGKINTSNTKTNDANLSVNTSNFSITSKEGNNNSKMAIITGNIDNPYDVSENGTIYLNNNGSTGYAGLEKTIYYSLYADNFFVKASNLGEYKLIFNLEGGTIEGSSAKIEKVYKIAKDSTILRGISIEDPFKKYYKFDGRYLADGTPAIGQTVKKGQTLELYAHYSLANYNINYMIVYDDDENKQYDASHFIQTFNHDDLDLVLPVPVDPEYNFYGWYIGNDLTNTISKITLEMGYQDINLYGVFSKSKICKVSFDANGHPDYFDNLESFNIATSDPNKVKLPTSLNADKDPTKEYYLVGWEDPNGKIFKSDTYGAFESEALVLKAKWGNKFTVTYKTTKTIAGSNGNHAEENLQFVDYIKPMTDFTLRGTGMIDSDYQSSQVDADNFKSTYSLTGWENNGTNYALNGVYKNIESDLVFNGIYSKDIRYKLTVLIENTIAPTRANKPVMISSQTIGDQNYKVPYLSSDFTEIFYVPINEKITLKMDEKGWGEKRIYWKITGGTINLSGDTNSAVNENWNMPSSPVTIHVNYKD